MNMQKSEVLDRVWMLVNKNNEVLYCIGRSPKEVWEQAAEMDLGTGVTTAHLRRQGYRAKKVAISLDSKAVHVPPLFEVLAPSKESCNE